MNATHRYIVVWTVLTCGGLAATAALNVLADADAIFPRAHIDGLAPYRQNLGSRVAKSEMILRNESDLYLVGSSRVEVAFDPSTDPWADHRAVNVGLVATHITEMRKVVDLIAAQSRAKRVVLGLDFLMFRERYHPHPSYAKSRLDPNRHALEHHIENLVGWRATKGSIITMGRWAMNVPSKRNPDGHLRSLTDSPNHERMFRSTLLRFRNSIYRDFAMSPTALDELEAIVRRCREADIELTIVIPPVHALHLELIRDVGLIDEYFDWKESIVRTINASNERDSERSPIDVWDFATYHRHATEPVPIDRSNGPKMRWFWENSHMTKELGQIVAQTLMEGGSQRGTPDAPRIGTLLTPDNVQAQRTRLINESGRYRVDHPDQMRLLDP